MPFVPAPNIIEVEFRYILFAQHCENRIMIDNLAAVDATALEDTAILCWNWWETSYAANITSQVLLVEVVATDLTVADGGQFTYAPDTTTTGTGSASAMPNEVSVCISLRSTSRGRSARGRWYVAGVPNNQMATANEIEPTYQSALAADMNTLIAAIDTAGQKFVIVSYVTAGAPRVGGPVYYVVENALIIDRIVDSMRRRKPGVGS